MTSTPINSEPPASLLGWDLKDLSARSGISESTLKNLERVGLGGQFATVRKVLETYPAAGIEFPGRGVSLEIPNRERQYERAYADNVGRADAIYNQACDLAHGRLTAVELYHVGYSLMLLGLSKMDQGEREAELNVLDPTPSTTALTKLDALRQRKKLNGHEAQGGAGHMKGEFRKPAQPSIADRDPGPRELQRQAHGKPVREGGS